MMATWKYTGGNFIVRWLCFVHPDKLHAFLNKHTFGVHFNYLFLLQVLPVQTRYYGTSVRTGKITVYKKHKGFIFQTGKSTF